MRVKIAYIAGKITGEPDYRKKFAEVEKRLTAKGHIVLNPAMLPEGMPYESYMRIGFAMIDTADTVYLLPNWVDSPGAKREKQYAEKCGVRIMPIYEIGGWYGA
jgi:hypothetical protein